MFNLSFLNASILAFAAATIIPLLIHLFAKRRPKVVVFPSLRFIRQSLRKQNRRIRLWEILLLVMRMLVVLFTVLAVARPILKAPFLKKGDRHARTAVAIVFDNSYSMDYLLDTKTDLETGRGMIGRINNLLTPDDMSALFTLNAGWNRLNAHLQVGPVPQKLVQTVQITPQAADLRTVLEEADRMLTDSQLPNREIYLVTDRQRSSLPAKTEAALFMIGTSNLQDKANQSCRNVRVKHDLVNPGSGWAVQFEVANHSRSSGGEVLCQLVLDDVAQTEKLVSLTPGQTVQESFPLSFDSPGWHSGYVEVKNERLEYDNRGYFTVNYNPTPKVAVLTGETELPLPLQALLGMYAHDVVLLHDTPSAEAVSEYSAIVVYKKPYDGQLRFLLDKIQSSGQGFLFVADSQMGRDWQDWAKSALGLEISGFDTGKANITGVNAYHPVTALLNADALRRSSVNGFCKARLNGGDSEVLLEGANGPLSVIRERVAAYLFDPADLRSSFFTDSAFPVFGWRTLEAVSNSAGNDTPHTVGDRFILSGAGLVLPDGSAIETSLPAYVLSQPGIYRLTRGDETRPLAVNLDDSEGDFFAFDAKQVKPAHWTTDNWINEILLTRFGFETWKILLILVLLLLAGEMVLVKKMEKQGE
jgi:hypothetical protein